ncbi:MAG: hypothetical protein GY750_00720 [Lentisphaerae bacterium]|nr:hypothetical protein [Lentisphaerota bacterium]MCP4099943.1 hypothetical protein [Lentisphaerota bacterium]
MKTELALAIGAALIDALRAQIKFSANILKISSEFRSDNLYKFEKIGTSLVRNSPFCSALEAGHGYCGELSYAGLRVARYLKLSHLSGWYISALYFKGDHLFLLIHEGKLTAMGYYDKVADSFKDLNRKYKGAVIVDPWIYTASRLSEHKQHLKIAESYGVLSFYSDIIVLDSKQIPFTGTPVRKPSMHYEEACVIDFYKFLRANSLDYYIGSTNYAKGASYSEIREEFINASQRYKDLLSLYFFVQSVKSHSSMWIKLFIDDSTKVASINKVIEYLAGCKREDTILRKKDLQFILISFIRICFIPQAESYFQEKNKLARTNTGEALITELQKVKFDFEDKSFSLDFIRNNQVSAYEKLFNFAYGSMLAKPEDIYLDMNKAFIYAEVDKLHLTLKPLTT